jgi:hypothetical protein
MSLTALDAGLAPVTLAALRPLLGADVVVRTDDGSVTFARLLSVVRDSAWFVCGEDDDLVLHLDEISSIGAA